MLEPPCAIALLVCGTAPGESVSSPNPTAQSPMRIVFPLPASPNFAHCARRNLTHR